MHHILAAKFVGTKVFIPLLISRCTVLKMIMLGDYQCVVAMISFLDIMTSSEEPTLPSMATSG